MRLPPTYVALQRSVSVHSRVSRVVRRPAMRRPVVWSGQLPAWFAAAGVQTVRSPCVLHFTRRGSLEAPSANTKRSGVIHTARQPMGLFVVWVACVGVELS